jgi:NADH-quinone oxidoreductase subunit G
MALSMILDGQLVAAAPEQNLLAAGLGAGRKIPYFCWHPALGAVGSCRQCAVKIFTGPGDMKGHIVMACMTKPVEGMRVVVDDPEAAKFREAVIEMVLTNHPHDCPVCEVGGECHLQDMTALTGHHARRYHFPKRTHLNQNLGPFIRHEMNRCIGCYRCVRFYRDYAGGDDFGVFGAHKNVYFGRAEDGPLESPFAGNLVEICPTGVFVDKPFSERFRRKWDMRATPSICPHCAVGCNITVQERNGNFRRVMNRFNPTLNTYFLCDRGRFGTGFLNSEVRLTQARDAQGHALSLSTGRQRLAVLLREEAVIGIGSPRACVEANFALRALVGEQNFYAGFSAFESAALRMALSIMRHIKPATLAQIEAANMFLLLGDDPALVAPRVALALRQAARNADTPCMTATAAPGWLDSVTKRVNEGPASAFAEALIREVNGTVPAKKNAKTLMAAAQPVIVAGGGADLLAKAARLVLALRARGVAAQLSLLLPEANSAGLGMMDTRTLSQAAAAASHQHVIILERDIMRTPEIAARLLASARSVAVLDHINTQSVMQADLAIPVGNFTQSDGIFINLEGRVQPFFKAIFGDESPPASWQLLRDAGIEAGRLGVAQWPTHAALLASLAAAVPALAPCAAAWPARPDRPPATLPHRHSGRTAATAHVNVQEAASPRHDDYPFSTSMEGRGTALPWEAGWNSVQITQILPAPAMHDIFLFADQPGEIMDPPDESAPDDRVLGVEELSSLSPAIIARQGAKSA